MSGVDGRRPWWYSGDDEMPPDSGEGGGAQEPAPEGQRPEESEQPGEAAGMDWTVLMAGAQRMVDWATEKVMAPHAEHDDPADHPQCMVCRTILLVGDRSGLGMPASGETPEPAAPAAEVPDDGPSPIQWIPIRD